jgi:hypothetical protein
LEIALHAVINGRNQLFETSKDRAFPLCFEELAGSSMAAQFLSKPEFAAPLRETAMRFCDISTGAPLLGSTSHAEVSLYL